MKVNELIHKLNKQPLDADVDMVELLKIVLDSQIPQMIETGNYKRAAYHNILKSNHSGVTDIQIENNEIGFVFHDGNLAGIYNWKE